MKTLYSIVLIVILAAGCAPSSVQLTTTAMAAQAQTQTAAPTLTATQTLTPTSTPKPTETPEPTKTPTPVPAVVGETIEYKDLEITLLEVVTHTQVMLSDFYGYDANEGYIFIDLAVLVRNQGGSATGATMGEVYIVDEDDKAWNPFYGGFRTVELERPFNPLATIKLDRIFGIEIVTFKKDTYLRLVWPVREHQDLLFGIQNSPQFTFSVP